MNADTVAFHPSREFAVEMDQRDPLAEFREHYLIPRRSNGERVAYFVGNSLGLQPKGAREAIDQELRDWAELAVDGHFDAAIPWFDYHEIFRDPEADIVGARPGEVVVMNTLTVNLHLMLISFYRPTATRYRILIERSAFPSDQYAVDSQVRLHGYNPSDAVVEVAPREGEDAVRTEDVEALLEEIGETVALVLFGGVNYYSGQAFDMAAITAAAHRCGAIAGFDLAHAAGNLVLQLHDWDVDFAVWCTYKYLNSGPGGVSGCFVHERHAFEPDIPRLAGWWGNDPANRFEMPREFVPQRGASGWQLSNAQILPMAVHRVALHLFERAGMRRLREKSELLTGYLEFLLDAPSTGSDRFGVITPRDPRSRGAQLSIRIDGDAAAINARLAEHGIVGDVRRPDVIRVAPVPMYNTFEEVWRLAETLRRL